MAGHTKTGNEAEGWVLAAYCIISSLIGRGDTVAPDISGQATGNSGRVGGPTVSFLTFLRERRVTREGGESGYRGGGRRKQITS